MAYKLYKTGDQVRDDLDAVEEKTIYPDASVHEKGLMTKEHVQRLNELDNKVDKVAGKGLSTNDYTNEDKQKVDSALQSETDPTVPSWAKQPSKPSYTAQEVGALPNSTKYGSTIDLAMDSATYVLTLSLKDQDGTVLNTKTVDLPIESVVVNGRYDAANKKIVLTLQSGSTIDVPVGDLIAGLQTEITALNMLDADLVDDANSTHKFVTTSEKSTWNAKYDKPASGIPASDLAAGVIPDISGKADKSEMSVVDGTGTDSDKTTITLKSGTNATVLKSHQDVSNFITKSVDDLVNYYLKSETYTKTEVQTLINAVKQFTYEVVQTLPTATADTMHKIYLVPSADPQTQNVKDEYITIDNGTEAQTRYMWEQIGSTAIDLSGYVTTTALNTALADYTTTADLTTLLAGKQDKIDSSHKLSADLIEDGSTNKAYTATEKTKLNSIEQGAQVNVKPDWNAQSGSAAEILNKPTIPAAQIQSDWNQSDNTQKDYIKNKPTTMGASGSGHKGGLVPDTPSTAGTTKFLREDGTWEVPAGGSAAAYTPTLNSAPTSSTTTYTKDGQTVDFEIGQFCRVAVTGGYDFYQMYDLNNGVASWEKMENDEVPSNIALISPDSGVGIVPDDGIRAETVTSAAAMTINADVVTVIDGAVGTATITLQVPNDNLAHVWDIIMTTGATPAITFAMSNSETILYPSGFSVAASKAVEISVIGVGTKYYLRYGEFA